MSSPILANALGEPSRLVDPTFATPQTSSRINIPWGETNVLKHLKSKDEWNEKSLGAKGFTLIELLVVIVILGILAAVVVFSVRGITDKGDSSACKATRNTVDTAIEAYRALNSTYPSSVSQLVGGTSGFLKQTPDPKFGTVQSISTTTGDVTWQTPTNCP